MKNTGHIIYRHLFWILGLTLVFLLWKGKYNGFSVLAGGLAYWLPTSYFVWRVCRQAANHPLAGKRYLRVFMIGESIKLLVSAALFVVVALYFPVVLVFVMIGFTGAVVTFWIACANAARKT